MATDSAFFDIWTPRALALLRIVTAFLFVQHGTAKLFGIPYMSIFADVRYFSVIGFAGALEVVGGTLLLLGLYTRPTAFVVCGEMAAAYFIAHAPLGAFFSPLLNGGESAVLYCFIFLYFSAAGAGRWSLDAMRYRMRG